MKVAIISPLKHLKLSDLGGMHFCLAQRVLESEEYAEYYRSQEHKWVIMDNGAFEKGEPLETEKLLEAAKLASVDEIVVPDYPLKPKKTLNAISNFLASLSKNERDTYDFLVVPHGKSIAVLLENLKDIIGSCCYYNEIDSIGWSVIDLWKYQYRARPLAVFSTLSVESGMCFKHHLLGLDDARELLCYLSSSVRSVDTSLPISLAASGHQLSFKREPIGHNRVSLDKTLPQRKLRLSEENIKLLVYRALTFKEKYP